MGLYSLVDQTLLLGDSVRFESVGAIVPGNFDVSLAGTTGQVLFLTAGVYSVSWRVSGQLTPPFPDPVPVWALALYLDGVAVPGSCFAGFSLFPEELSINGASNVLLVVAAGQVLTLQSTSLMSIDLVSSTPGSSVLPISATLTIIKE